MLADADMSVPRMYSYLFLDPTDEVYVTSPYLDSSGAGILTTFAKVPPFPSPQCGRQRVSRRADRAVVLRMRLRE